MMTVVLPVGPEPHHEQWLGEALMSIANQTTLPTEVLIVNDHPTRQLMLHSIVYPITEYRPPWRLGVAHAFNAGVALAPTECVFMMGADDTLEPDCLQECYNEWMQRKGEFDSVPGYFAVSIKYMDTGEVQTLPCHAAMVTKSLWRVTGGLPTEAASGASDAALLSIMIGNYPKAGRIYKVKEGTPLYNYRRHDNTDTAARGGAWQGVIVDTRNIVTEQWQPPTWTFAWP